MKRLSLTLSVLLCCFLAGCVKKPNLVVQNLQVTWNAQSKTAVATIANTGNASAGSFSVYFDGDENPVSQNYRPQVSVNVASLAAGASTTLNADFGPLARPQNFNLANVHSITVTADPKNAIAESNETDNKATHSAP